MARGAYRPDQVISTYSYQTRPGQPAQIGVRCDRTVAPKGGRLRNRTGGHDLKMLLMRFSLFYLYLSCLELQHKHDLDFLEQLSLSRLY
jgi:hypothetical protein